MINMSVRKIVHELTEMDVHIKEQSDHYKIFTNEIQRFEVEILQDELDNEGYTSWRFDNDGVQFLKVPK